MFLARIRCPWCDGDNAHRVCHDDLTPPDPATLWAYRCPQSRRLVRVDARTTEWTRHRPPLTGPQPQTLLDLLPRKSTRNDCRTEGVESVNAANPTEFTVPCCGLRRTRLVLADESRAGTVGEPKAGRADPFSSSSDSSTTDGETV